MRQVRKFLSSAGVSGYLLLLGAIVINVVVQGPSFFSAANFTSILSVNTPLIIAAIAQTIVVLNRGIDLSVGSNITLVNTIVIMLSNKYGWSIEAACAVGLLAGTFIGAINGFIIAYFRIPSLLATFATMSVFGGLALIVLPTPGGSVPSYMYLLYGGQTLGIPNSVFIVIVVALIWLLLSKYPIGKHIRAVGGAEKSAYTSGISIAKVRFTAFTLAGMISGIAGLCITALTASGDPKIGLSITLNCIAAVILGGTRLAGGWGGIGGSMAGAVFLGLVNNIVFFFFNNFLTHFSGIASRASFIQQLLTNTIIILGLASAVFTQRRKKRAKIAT
jgi:ribose transport system permease protein